jgi:hypothetical protein
LLVIVGIGVALGVLIAFGVGLVSVISSWR